MEIRRLARAKVNLALHVTGQLPNGMHILDSLVAFPNIGDILTFQNADGVSLSVEGCFGDKLRKNNKISENIVFRAVQLMKNSDKGVAIKLIKNLPVASGIGGGSSDAAATIIALAKIWNQSVPSLDKVLKLGADVPVCLSTNFQRVQGVGDRLTALQSPPPIWIVLANPGIQISTAKVFRTLISKNNSPLENVNGLNRENGLIEYLLRQRNDLEPVTCELVPMVKVLLDFFKENQNCKLFRMSGSGATCFGLYLEKEAAERTVCDIKKSFPMFWVKMGKLFSASPRNDELG